MTAAPVWRTRQRLILCLLAVLSLAAFVWPFWVSEESSVTQSADAPLVLIALMGIIAIITIAEASAFGIDPKAATMLAVLSGVGAVLRPLGAGTAGIEPMFFVLILAGRVFGPAFGFVLGASTMFVSAVLTAGMGPWLPFQMIAAAWVGLGAGLLPPAKGRSERALLVGYVVVASFLYGALMNLWFWPFAVGSDTSISFVAGDPVTANLARFLLFELVTSLGWDIGRAVTNGLLIWFAGPALLIVLRRAATRASFRDSQPSFVHTPSNRDEQPSQE